MPATCRNCAAPLIGPCCVQCGPHACDSARSPGPLGAFAVFRYALWYVYRATRRYYGEGRWLALAKRAALSAACLVFLVLTRAGTFLVGALVA